MTQCVRIYEPDHKWLLDHRDSKRKGLANVVYEVIEFWQMCQNEDT